MCFWIHPVLRSFCSVEEEDNDSLWQASAEVAGHKEVQRSDTRCEAQCCWQQDGYLAPSLARKPMSSLANPCLIPASVIIVTGVSCLTAFVIFHFHLLIWKYIRTETHCKLLNCAVRLHHNWSLRMQYWAMSTTKLRVHKRGEWVAAANPHIVHVSARRVMCQAWAW